jgi:hypothetical protein
MWRRPLWISDSGGFGCVMTAALAVWWRRRQPSDGNGFGCNSRQFLSKVPMVHHVNPNPNYPQLPAKLSLLIRKIPAITSSFVTYHKTPQLSQVSHCGWGLSKLDIDEIWYWPTVFSSLSQPQSQVRITRIFVTYPNPKWPLYISRC